jgi:hypothetical protein
VTNFLHHEIASEAARRLDDDSNRPSNDPVRLRAGSRRRSIPLTSPFSESGTYAPVYVARGIDTIGVTNVDLTLLGHGYIGDAREVLTDIHQLITTGAAPDQRFGLTEAMTSSGERYWLIRG